MVRVGFQKKHPRKWLFASVLSAAKGPGIALVSPLMGGGRVEREAVKGKAQKILLSVRHINFSFSLSFLTTFLCEKRFYVTGQNF